MKCDFPTEGGFSPATGVLKLLQKSSVEVLMGSVGFCFLHAHFMEVLVSYSEMCLIPHRSSLILDLVSF